LWKDGKTTDLNTIGTLGGATNSAFNANDFGHVVGVNSSADNSEFLAVLWRNGQFIPLSTLSGDDCSEPFRINNADQIVGISFSCETGASHAFIWERGQMVDLDTLIPSTAGIQLTSANWINDEGVIAAQGVLIAGSDMGASRAVLLIPDGECDPATLAAAQAAQVSAALGPSVEFAGRSSSKSAIVFGAAGRLDPLFFKPFTPAALLRKMQTQSN
jgi:probable HAF family extracellular repeat protein